MSAPLFSLQTVEQQSLFEEHELDLLSIDKPETRKRYTAESLAKNIAKRDAIVRALAEGHGLLRIAKAFGVSHHLVSALRDARPDLVAIEKKQLSGQLGRILKMSADRFEEALEKGLVPAGQIPVAFGIFADKRAQLDGEASMIVEHRHRVYGSADGFRAKLQAAVDSKATGNTTEAQQKGVIVDAEVISDTSSRAPVDGQAGVQAMAVDQIPPAPGAGTPAPATPTPGGGDASGAGLSGLSMHPSGGAK